MNPPDNEAARHPLRKQIHITYDRYPALVIAIVCTWAAMIVLSVGGAVVIDNTRSNSTRIENNGLRSEQAICAIKNFADRISSRDPDNSQELHNLAVNLGHLVHCRGAEPAQKQPDGN